MEIKMEELASSYNALLHSHTEREDVFARHKATLKDLEDRPHCKNLQNQRDPEINPPGPIAKSCSPFQTYSHDQKF